MTQSGSSEPEVVVPAIESKVESITMKVTPGELRDARMVAALHDADLGPLLRDRSLNDILAEAAEFKEKHRVAQATA